MEKGTPSIPKNWSAPATVVTKNPVASAFMCKCLIYYIVTVLIGSKPSNLSDAKQIKNKYHIYKRIIE